MVSVWCCVGAVLGRTRDLLLPCELRDAGSKYSHRANARIGELSKTSWSGVYWYFGMLLEHLQSSRNHGLEICLICREFVVVGRPARNVVASTKFGGEHGAFW